MRNAGYWSIAAGHCDIGGIGGTCYTAGARNPGNACQTCNSLGTTWLGLPNNTYCGAGGSCGNAICCGGACVDSGYPTETNCGGCGIPCVFGVCGSQRTWECRNSVDPCDPGFATCQCVD